MFDDLEMDTRVPHEQVKTSDQILQEMLLQQRENFITDLFALMATVLRNRVGRILQEKGDTAWDDIIRYKDAQIFAFSMIGVLCNVCIASIFWYNDKIGPDPERGGAIVRRDLHLEDVDMGITRKVGLYSFQFALTTTTIITCILIAQKYMLYVEEKKREWSGIDTYNYVQAYAGLRDEDNEHRENAEKILSRYEKAYSFWRSPLRWACFAEITIQLIHPTIWMNTPDSVWRTFYEVLEVLIFLRLYLGVKIVFSFSREYKSRHKILASNSELQRSGFQITAGSTLKMLFFKYPGTFAVSLLVISLINLGFIVFILERRFQPQITSFGKLENAFWFAFVTFSTVGYGDMAPISPLGRLASIFLGAVGITITTIVGGVTTNLMVQSREQRYVSEYLNMVKAADSCKDSAARVIQAAWRYYRIRSGDVMNPWRGGGHKSNFVYANIKEFRSHRWNMSQSKSTANDPVIDSKMNRLSVTLLETVKHLEKHEKSITATAHNIDSYVRDIARLLER